MSDPKVDDRRQEAEDRHYERHGVPMSVRNNKALLRRIERETERKIGALIFVAALIMIGLRLNSMYPGWGNIWWDLWCMVIGAIAVHGVDEDEYLS